MVTVLDNLEMLNTVEKQVGKKRGSFFFLE